MTRLRDDSETVGLKHGIVSVTPARHRLGLPDRSPGVFLSIAGLVGALALPARGGSAPAPSPRLELPAVIGSHMVLQRDGPVPIWGTAPAGAAVEVVFAGQTQAAHAAASGAWRVALEPIPASAEARTLTITALAPGVTNALVRTLDDVLVGEVWVGSGQSNMDMPVHQYVEGDSVLAALAQGEYPNIRLLISGKSAWQPAVPAHIRPFSALLFAFGLRLHQELGVPVGLMEGAVGGTPSGLWLREEAVRSDPACQAAISNAWAEFSQENYDKECARVTATWSQTVARAAETGTPLGATLTRGPILPLKPGESRGVMGALYQARVRPLVPFAIHGVLWDQGESGTAIGGVDQVTLMAALIRSWREAWGQGDFPFLYVQKPSGGGCALDPANPVTGRAEAYAKLPKDPPAQADFRERHLRIRQNSNTAMVTASDLGSGIHPACKSGYGERAARVALGFVYGRPVEIYGPIYRSHDIEGSRVRIRFDHVGQGLAIPKSASTNVACADLTGFALAGTNRVWHWAQAVIENDTVVVSCELVPEPVAVRYAWSERHPWANLFNRDGLPALPFRTDDWSVKTRVNPEPPTPASARE